MKKRMIIVVMLLISLALLAGCSKNHVRISRSSVQIENVILPMRNRYCFAEDAYTITETERGYDIVIHAVREEEGHEQSGKQ